MPGRHAFEARIEGNAITTYVDGVQYATSNKFARTGTVAVGLPNCNSGYVYKIQITDLTDNQVVWSYPSEAERVRLITKTNVRTDRGAFEAADETQSARVDTALDLRGKVSSYTVVVDFEAAAFPETTTTECHQELAGQGGALIGSGTPPICSIGYYLASSGNARLQLSQEVAGGRHVVNATLTGRLSGRHICCGVVEVDPASPLTASTLYLDGVEIGNASIYAVPTGNAAVTATCFSIAGHSFTGRLAAIYRQGLFGIAVRPCAFRRRNRGADAETSITLEEPMRYIRKINGYVEESPIPPYRGAEYYAARGYLRSDSTLPLSRLDIVDGEIIELPEPEPTEEWVDKEAFINALYALIPAEYLTAALQDPEAFKQGIAGLALLTTDAAPGGQIDLMDPRVPAWLAAFDLTLEAVRAKMEESADAN